MDHHLLQKICAKRDGLSKVDWTLGFSMQQHTHVPRKIHPSYDQESISEPGEHSYKSLEYYQAAEFLAYLLSFLHKRLTF